MYCKSLVTPRWPGPHPVHVHCLPRAPTGSRGLSAAGHCPPSELYSPHSPRRGWASVRFCPSTPNPPAPPPQLVQDRAPSRTRLSSVLGPLCAGNGVSDALYDPEARAFPRSGLFPLPRPPLPTLRSHCLPHAQLVGGLEEQPGARAEPGRSRCKDSQWVFFSCRGWGGTGYQACWDLNL